jgi:NAD(P)H-nitrite reductase large subunit
MGKVINVDKNTIWYLRSKKHVKKSLDRRNRSLRTVYLEDNRLVGFQLVGDISAVGILRALLLQEKDVPPFKDRLLDPAFGQGYAVWSAINALG